VDPKVAYYARMFALEQVRQLRQWCGAGSRPPTLASPPVSPPSLFLLAASFA
jgi:hypothetical protein